MTACARCGFELWTPVAATVAVTAGLYDDGRFPGRLILSLVEHHDHLEDVPADLAVTFLQDAQRAVRAQREALQVPRVDIAVLGNQVSHVHAHLVPRRRSDPRPTRSPWEDPRPRGPLDPGAKADVLHRLTQALAADGWTVPDGR